MTAPRDDPPPEQCNPPRSEWVPERTPAIKATLEWGKRLERARIRRLTP
jgi:hypothetical protein